MKKLLFILASMVFISCNQDDFDDSLEIAMPVSIQEVKPGSIEEFITSTATVNAVKNTRLSSEVSGLYRLAVNPQMKRPFAPGDRVSGGQVIIYLDNPEFENNVKIDAQKLNLDISKSEYEKEKSLYDKGGVTLRELKNAERTFIEAKYSYDNALLQLAKLEIKAPFSSVIVDLPYYTEGSKVETNQLMVQLMDYSELYAEVYFPAKEMDQIKVHQKVRVTHYNLPGDTLSGKISNVSPAINPETRSFKASLLIKNTNLTLRPGMFVRVETTVAQKDSVIVIPKEIILSKRRGKTVFVVEKGASFQKVISTGLENDLQVEVIDGLKFDDRLVVKGFETLRDRSKVKVVR